MPPVLCTTVSTKQSLLGLGLSITSIMSLIAFVTGLVMFIIIRCNASMIANRYQYNNYNNNNYNNYNNYNKNYYYNYYYYWNNRNNNNNKQNQGGEDDREARIYQLVSSVGSYSVVFVGIYTAFLALALTLFGSMSVVGYTSLSGKYIPPTWTGTSNQKVDRRYFGIFIGVLVMLGNLFLVVSVVFSECYISGLDEREMEEFGFFAIEQITKALGTILRLLSVTYFIYAVIVFACKDEILQEEPVSNISKRYRSPRHRTQA